MTNHFIEDIDFSTFAQKEDNTNPQSLAFLPPGQVSWINNDKKTLYISTETNEPISGNSSLRVEVQPAATIEETVNSSWSVVSTDFIPANDDGYYSYSLNVSAKDVNRLHSKVIYYDSNKKEIDSDFIFVGRDGTFQDEFSKTISPEIGTEFIKLQMWIRKSLEPSRYLADNVKILENTSGVTVSNNNDSEVTVITDHNLMKPNSQNNILFFETFDGSIDIVGNDNVPRVIDPNLKVETVFKGIKRSTNMAFLGSNDILVLEQVSGKVQRIVNGQMLETPLIDVNSYHQDGLTGIATQLHQNGSSYVFLYFNEAPAKFGADVSSPEQAEIVNSTLGYDRDGDRLYRYELMGNKLVYPKILIDLPVPIPNNHLGGQHRGGEVVIGPDSAVYLVVGDLDGRKFKEKTRAQNYKDGIEPDGRAGILRVTQDGKAIGEGILGNTYPLNLYYAYGIRNSFGMDFDPVTGNLWDTENGPDEGDEINLVEPGFNSGSYTIHGMSTESDNLDSLVDFDGKGKYSDPEFSWNKTVAPTAITFFNSDKFGEPYENDMFVADWNFGNIYHFDLNEERTGLSLNGSLQDKVADTPEETDEIIFAQGFTGGITDMQVGPDGYLYILSSGAIFRIIPNN